MISDLKQTVGLMNSSDYKERFLAEYFQLRIRLSKLRTMLLKWDGGNLEFTPTVPREAYDDQVDAMTQYLYVLEKRAEIEEVDLDFDLPEVGCGE